MVATQSDHETLEPGAGQCAHNTPQGQVSGRPAQVFADPDHPLGPPGADHVTVLGQGPAQVQVPDVHPEPGHAQAMFLFKSI